MGLRARVIKENNVPCSPNEVSLNVPSGPSGPAIPGFGTSFALKLPQISPFPAGFPEDLLDILNKLQFLIPPGALKPQLNPNFGKDIFDGIMKMLDQFMPFLMLYKFFLPILNIIICIIEVLCALMNPFALISAINRLFSQCIPEFLNLFPIFALIIMIVSLLLLIVALIEYVTAQILKLVQAILRNIAALNNAFQSGDSNGVLAIAQKLGALLCVFQNLFVLFSLFNIIIDIVKDILNLAFAIPPCQSGDSGDINSCCTPETCPTIVQGPYSRTSGTFKYFSEIGGSTVFGGGFPAFTFASRNEMWQFYDLGQDQAQAFRNIFDAFDIVNVSPKPIFFPSATTYGVGSDLRQVPYVVSMRMFYNPSEWGRTGPSRYVRFNNCIITTVPTTNLIEADNSIQTVNNAVASLVGGAGFEDNNTTPLQAYGSDGVTPISGTADLNNFFHRASTFTTTYSPPNINDGYTFSNVEYTFTPNIAPLLQHNLVVVGCVPSVKLNKEFINNVIAGNIGLKTQELGNLVNGRNGNVFPDPAAAQQCMTAAITALRSNMTTQGVATFQATCNACLAQLQSDTQGALNSIIGLGVDPCSSSFTLTPSVQFTSQTVDIAVSLNETNGLSMTNNLPPDVATNIAARLKAYTTFGTVGAFAYDGYQFFNAQISSVAPGPGTCMVSFDNQILCTNTLSSTESPTHTLQSLPYQFIFTTALPIPEGDSSDGQPRRDAGDVSRDGGS
jgi:hypothetical protein